MSRTEVVWKDKVRCPSCGTENSPREEWCQVCLADIPSARANSMFVRKWAHRSRAERG